MDPNQTPATWLEALHGKIDIDIDCMDPEEARKLLPFKPCDQTSNQRLVYEQMISPANRDLFLSTVRENKDESWKTILTKMSVLLCSKNRENISGRVLVQTSAFDAYDTDKVAAHARAYAQEFEAAGISKDGFCIKIPCTGPALNACRTLLKEGIRTLGTSLFSVPQAIAASQAGCLSISPYYNFPWYHADPSLWPDVKDPALEHPMTPRIMQIIITYKALSEETGKVQPMLKPASFKSAREVMSMAELGCQSATVPEDILQRLSSLKVVDDPPPGYGEAQTTERAARLASIAKTDPLKGTGAHSESGLVKVDYLLNNGAALDKTISGDDTAKRGLFEALEAFKENELQSKAAIEAAMKESN